MIIIPPKGEYNTPQNRSLFPDKWTFSQKEIISLSKRRLLSQGSKVCLTQLCVHQALMGMIRKGSYRTFWELHRRRTIVESKVGPEKTCMHIKEGAKKVTSKYSSTVKTWKFGSKLFYGLLYITLDPTTIDIETIFSTVLPKGYIFWKAKRWILKCYWNANISSKWFI